MEKTLTQSNGIVRKVISPFGSNPKRIKLFEETLIIQDKITQKVPLSEILFPPTVNAGFWFSSIQIKTVGGTKTTLKLANKKETRQFAKALEQSIIAFYKVKIDQHHSSIERLIQQIDDLKSPKQFPAACYLSPILESAKELDSSLLAKLPYEGIEEVVRSKITKIKDFIHNADEIRQNAIEKFLNKELKDKKSSFELAEKNPLTLEQRLAVISDEDATLVLASAGSGKTSVISAKTGYLIQSGIRKPSEMLLLAYGKEAAKEMSTRVKYNYGKTVMARTFHSLGMEIIKQKTGSNPKLAQHILNNNSKSYRSVLMKIVNQIAALNSPISKKVIDWFSLHRLENKSEWEFPTLDYYYKHIEKNDLQTLQGETVKSYEELIIANWLFRNGIDYQYEKKYEPLKTKPRERGYLPDFYLTNSKTYLEHFGVRKRKFGNGKTELYTAPFVDRKKYLEGMEWKRKIHQKYGTTLIETYSYQRQEGRLLEALEEKIASVETINPRSDEEIIKKIQSLNFYSSSIDLFGTFLKHFKESGLTLSECRKKARENKDFRALNFLDIFESLYERYQEELGDSIDFEDMVIQATKFVESNDYSSPYRHIIIDEFQDISNSRAKLIKALLAKHKDARLFAVGDDWQSIYRFAGSNIWFMKNFNTEFGGSFNGRNGVSETLDLGKTFRSSEMISRCAREFILKNPNQITKKVDSVTKDEKIPIRLFFTELNQLENKIEDALQAIHDTQSPNGNPTQKILLLGRYNHDEPKNLQKLKEIFPQFEIHFKTIHSSKGLEADHVILLNLQNGKFGFPSNIADDPILNLVLPEQGNFENAEERRVMYVALTRARYTVTLISPPSRFSPFLKELIRDQNLIDYERKHNVLDHPCPQCGGLMFNRFWKNGNSYLKCSRHGLCSQTQALCQICMKGIPQRESNPASVAKCSCGETYPACPTCNTGWLIPRKGKYGKFFGCVNYPITGCKGKHPKTIEQKVLTHIEERLRRASFKFIP